MRQKATAQELFALFSQAQTIYINVGGTIYQIDVEILPSRAQMEEAGRLVSRLVDEDRHSDYDVEAIEVDYA